MKKSIFFKIFGGHLLIIVLLSVLILLFSFRTIRTYYIDQIASNLENLASTLMSQITPLIEKEQSEAIDVMVKDLGRKINTRITVIDSGGKVLADSEKDPNLMENHADRPEVIHALGDDFGRSSRYSTTVKEEMLYIALPLKKGKETLGILRMSLFLKDIQCLLSNLKLKVLNLSLAAIILSLLGAIILSRNLSRPIKELSRASRQVGSGDFDTKVFLKSKGDLKELADNFNYMTEKIKSLFTDLSIQKEELNSIISSIPEGLLVLDNQGNVLLGNNSFKKIVQIDNIKGKPYWEILREVKFADLIKKVSSGKNNFSDEVELDEKIFLCSANFIPAKEEIVIILHDITELKRLETLKKDFVDNVSHELRTPLTAIKGYVETLEDKIDKKYRHYLDIIGKNTERLINIVQDLLALSALEVKNIKLQLEEIDFKNLIKDILKAFEQKIREKGLSLKLNIDKNIPTIKGDSFKLEQMLINLVDNALKYTEKGEISISLKKQANLIKLEVGDTGIGISPEHLERIFERFYVADKSRSKKLGGTGLGLSIVKHIVLLHNGSIKIESSPGAGAKFIVTLPIDAS